MGDWDGGLRGGPGALETMLVATAGLLALAGALSPSLRLRTLGGAALAVLSVYFVARATQCAARRRLEMFAPAAPAAPAAASGKCDGSAEKTEAACRACGKTWLKEACFTADEAAEVAVLGYKHDVRVKPMESLEDAKRAVPTGSPSSSLKDGMYPVRLAFKGGCAAFAAAAVAEFHLRDKLGPDDRLSAGYIFASEARVNNGSAGGAGMNFASCSNVLTRFGVAPESVYPSTYRRTPDDVADGSARPFRLLSGEYVTTMRGAKQALADGLPLLVGMDAYSFGRTFWKPSAGHATVLGGHAVVVDGYDDKEKVFSVRNCWGASWGDRGYTKLPYEDWGRVKSAFVLIPKA